VLVSKLDAARRQLDAAIRLFFVYGDPVAIHTLAHAARTVLSDLARKEGKDVGFDSMFREQIRPERVEEVRAMMRRAPNFFKHADRDAEETINFNPGTTQLLLYDGCWMYGALTSHQSPLIATFNIWWSLSHPEILTAEARAKIDDGIAAIGGLPVSPENRTGFRDVMLPAAEAMYAGA
jgi:hypothetical protein